MSVYCGELKLGTNGEVDIIDITADVQDLVSKSKIDLTAPIGLRYREES